MNFVDIAAVDGTGREATRTCAFLVASQWAPEAGALAGSVSLRLRQAAVDDGSRAGAIDSLADVLDRVLQSSGLRSTLHSALLAANPLKPSSCDQSVLGICVLRSEVIYLDSQLIGRALRRSRW